MMLLGTLLLVLSTITTGSSVVSLESCAIGRAVLGWLRLGVLPVEAAGVTLAGAGDCTSTKIKQLTRITASGGTMSILWA